MMKSKLNFAALFAMAAVAASPVAQVLSGPTVRRVKNYPRMVVSSAQEIAEHNSQVTTRQVTRRMSRKGW